MTKILVLLLLLGSPAVSAGEFRLFNEWSKEEKIEFLSYTGLLFIDYKQTEWAMEQKDLNGKFIYREANPFIVPFTGNRPNDAELAASQIIGLVGYYSLIGLGEDEKFRYMLMGLKIRAIIHNDQIGLSIKKVF